MKSKIVMMMVGILLGAASVALAESQVAGPKGGRLLEGDGMKAEFIIEKGHNVSLTFYDEKLSKMPVTGQKASMVAEAASGKKKIEFENRDGTLFSKEPLPEGHGYTVVVQLKKDDSSKTRNFRIPFETGICGECGKAEYACACEGH